MEITGINTAALPTLEESEREQLILRMKQGDKRAKDILVMSNLKLILSIIQRINIKNADPDDLFQVGCIGLIKALDNFDPSMNVQFSTYGVVMILGEIKRFLRDNNSIKVSRSTKDIAYKAMAFKERFYRENNREPTTDETAQYLGISRYTLKIAVESMNPAVSLYEPVFNDENESLCLADQISSDNFEDVFISKTIIKDILHNLQKREKYILNLRFLQGKTQMQVANIVGISQAQVSRIEKNVLSIVKKQLNI